MYTIDTWPDINHFYSFIHAKAVVLGWVRSSCYRQTKDHRVVVFGLMCNKYAMMDLVFYYFVIYTVSKGFHLKLYVIHLCQKYHGSSMGRSALIFGSLCLFDRFCPKVLF